MKFDSYLDITALIIFIPVVVLESYLSENLTRGMVTSLALIFFYSLFWKTILVEEKVLRIKYKLFPLKDKTYLWQSITSSTSSMGFLKLYFQYDKPVTIFCAGVDSVKVVEFINSKKIEEETERLTRESS